MLRITKSAKNLSFSIVEDIKVGSIGSGSDYKEKTVKRSPLTSKNWNGVIGYLTPDAKQIFTQLK